LNAITLGVRRFAAHASESRSGGWLLLLVVVATLIAIFHQGLTHVIGEWQREELSYGYIIPPITAWLLWQRYQAWPADRTAGSALGPWVVVLAVAVAVLATIGGMPTAIYYAFVLALYGIFLTLVGWRGLGRLAAPLAYLLFALPLPSTLYTKVSTAMQFISSELGVELIRLLGISVHLEGNVIDLGTYQLQVAEACNGLRYLLPLSSFAFLVAYLYRGPLWQKLVLFVSTVPITIIINSARVAITAVLVHHAGIAAAEGFIHWFEGWAIFLVGLALLYLEMWVLIRITRVPGGVWAHLRFEMLWPLRGFGERRRRLPGAFLAVSAVLVIAALTVHLLPARGIAAPERESLVTFPLGIGDWHGTDQKIEQHYLDILHLDDYLLADYRSPTAAAPVNLYIAYYKSQDQVASIHSPSVCIPAGGWEITRFGNYRVEGVAPGAAPLSVNRAIIVKGLSRQLVYYWFKQRARNLTNEYVIKAVNVWDALIRNRTDGALVRITTPIPAGEPVAAADQRLHAFLWAFYPNLPRFVPD
jgi:exosortase D (VPLPA-CTERM-specific)